jgi:transposase
MNPYHPENNECILLLDNASIHHSEEVLELCAEYGVMLMFLPAYSPDYAPVEKLFYNVKSWIRRNRDWVESLEDDENVGKIVLHRAIAETVTPALCDALFRSVRLW